MDNPEELYWQLRLAEVKENLEKNKFDVYLAQNCSQARDILVDVILPNAAIKRISRGGSKTVEKIAMETLKSDDTLEFIDPFETGIRSEKRKALMRNAFLADAYITGTNAVTEDGKLVNLDSLGNRVAAITFGPEFVIIFVGRNKVVSDLEAAMHRIKNYTAPANALKLDRKTPCVKTSRCMDCQSPGRICNAWSIIEKSNPKGRIKVVLVNEELGF